MKTYSVANVLVEMTGLEPPTPCFTKAGALPTELHPRRTVYRTVLIAAPWRLPLRDAENSSPREVNRP